MLFISTNDFQVLSRMCDTPKITTKVLGFYTIPTSPKHSSSWSMKHTIFLGAKMNSRYFCHLHDLNWLINAWGMENFESVLIAFCVYVGRKWPAPDINGTHKPNQSTVYPANPHLLRAHVHSIRWCLAQLLGFIGVICAMVKLHVTYAFFVIHPIIGILKTWVYEPVVINGLIYPIPQGLGISFNSWQELAESKFHTGGGHRWPPQIDRELYRQNATLQRWSLHHAENP